MPSEPHRFRRFGSFEIDAGARMLRKCGVRIRLQEQPFQVLLALLESPGEIVTREQLRQRLWPQGTFVEFDHALNTAVKKIRAALCDDAAVPRYIETIPRRGYRFLAPVDTEHSIDTQSSVESAVVGASSLARVRRFPTWIVACAVGIPVLMVSAWVFSRPSAANNVTVAVLPFSSMNPDSSHEPALALFPELLLTRLRRNHPARLIIRSMKAPGRGSLPVQREQSRIDYVVQGGVLFHERHLHVAVQLVRLNDQNCVWARDFDRDSDDAETEAEMAEEIVGQMQPALSVASGEPR